MSSNRTPFKVTSLLLLLMVRLVEGLALPLNETEPSAEVSSNYPHLAETYEDDLFRYAFFSGIAYCGQYDGELRVGKLKDACRSELCQNDENNIEVVFVYNGIVSSVLFRDDRNREIIWAFKGTTSLKEVGIDLRVKPISYLTLNTHEAVCDGCKIHAGFRYGAKNVYDDMSTEFHKLIDAYPDYDIGITGHSLGGALAVIVANEYMLAGHNVRLITFGQPKIGNYMTSAWMNEIWWAASDELTKPHSRVPVNSMVRITNHLDVVPLLPFTSMGFGHSGAEIRFDHVSVPAAITEAYVRGAWTKRRGALEELAIPKDMYSDGVNLNAHQYYFVKMNRCYL